MVFVDEKIILVIYLYNLLPKYIKKNRERLIKTFTLILKSDIKNKYLEDFYNNNTKIQFCMNAID